jgi:co-chaperonin GroES (HSP10)
MVPPLLTSNISNTKPIEDDHHTAKVVAVQDGSLIVKENRDKFYINVESDLIFNVGDTVTFEAYYSIPDDIGFSVYLKAKGTEYSGYAQDTIEIREESTS